MYEVIVVIGKILDMNKTDAFVSFEDGTTMDIGVPHLPMGAKVGEMVEIDPIPIKMTNDKLTDYF